MATGGGDGYVRIWDIGRGSDPTQVKVPNCRFISSLSYNKVGSILACSGTDLEITLIGVENSRARA
jgi:WD40 repeat protein